MAKQIIKEDSLIRKTRQKSKITSQGHSTTFRCKGKHKIKKSRGQGSKRR